MLKLLKMLAVLACLYAAARWLTPNDAARYNNDGGDWRTFYRGQSIIRAVQNENILYVEYSTGKYPPKSPTMYATLRLPVDPSDSKPWASVSLGNIPESVLADGKVVSNDISAYLQEGGTSNQFRIYLEPPEGWFTNWRMVWISSVYAPDDLFLLAGCLMSENCMRP